VLLFDILTRLRIRLGEVELLTLDPSSGQPIARMVGGVFGYGLKIVLQLVHTLA